MSPRTDTQNEKIRLERKQQIMNVALKVIADNGFSNASISRIAKEAGISKGLMYNYFESKEDLVINIMLEGFNQLTNSFDPNHDGVLTEEELHFFIDQSFQTVEQNIPFWRMYFMVLLQPDVYSIITPQLEKILTPFYKTAINYFASQGYDDPVTEVRFFAAIMDGVGLHYIMDPENFPMEGVKTKIHQLFKCK
ncbi:TetR/AcrR family transcriptional regulator [Carboxylicivirga linearis]|uniref:TetR/AcrR family transcriptional regulator n=1 Tax=Carboxylicivirga linearis TaxID=1628157 RepID=A0ABS5JSA9_9BACT|nr:TetR/AcrR family transcriptional regulator [Carboxylicivirga linearis]MBS2097685.1 TetR/AcrR family transcriptional regulator [Carboxylicivirga linearis]